MWLQLKGQNSFTKWKTGECFKWKANGSCSKGDSGSFLHSRASGNRETSAEEVKNTGASDLKPVVNNEQRRKCKGQASSSVPTGKGQTDATSREAGPATGAKIPCLLVVRCRHPPVCRDYKSGNIFIYGNSCLYRHADGEEKPQHEVEEREYSRSSCDSERKKKGPRLCVSKFRSKEVYPAESWANEIARFGGTHHKILRTHVVRNSNSGKKSAITGRYPKRRTS